MFNFTRVQVFLWLSNGQILKRKGRPEGLRKHSLRHLISQTMIRNTLHYLVPCLWDMPPLTMVMDTRSAV
uniref:Uncharacterized protein n=1 Tax=Rhizophora mucronata TaxID=61149 RepID=A0A2P2MV17_RHIMU